MRNCMFHLFTLALALAGGALPPAHADAVSRNTGITTPNLADFSTTVVANVRRAQYGNTQPQHIFLETLAARCTGQGARPSAANFHITLRKLPTTLQNFQSTQLSFWDKGQVLFATMLWTPSETVGTTRTFTYQLSTLPPHGGMVTASRVGAEALLRDGDFSFSVYGAASVVNARLDYRCSRAPQPHGGAHGVPSVVPLAAPPVITGGLPTHSFKLSWGSHDVPVACPRTHVKYGRAFARHDALISRMLPELDRQCLARGLGRQFNFVTLESCSEGEGEVGRRAGNRTFSLVTCAP